MASLRIRRAAGLAAVLSLALSATAVADTITAYGSTDVTLVTQTTVNLGDVEVGQTRDVYVDFVLTCAGSDHVPGLSTVSMVLSGLVLPLGADVSVPPMAIDVPAGWETCVAGATTTSTPGRVEVTAPPTTGADQQFTLLFQPDPATGITSSVIGVTIVMNVVEPTPVDDTPPVLHDVPGSMTVDTYGDSATVTWPLPTATDDTDPNPTVACAPPSGSTFPLGTTTVTCTATDATGNQASASFDVTVVHVPRLEGTWGQPLDDGVPALVGRAGRTVPLKLDVTADGVTQGPAAIDAPTLTVSDLASCSADAAAGPAHAAGTFDWSNGTWQLNLQTGDLGGGCWRLDARVDGTTFASAVIQLEGGGSAVAANRR